MNQYHKVLQDNGNIYIPVAIQKRSGMEPGDVVRMGIFKRTILIEKVDIPYVDIVKNLTERLRENPESESTLCFIQAAMSSMTKEQLEQLAYHIGDNHL